MTKVREDDGTGKFFCEKYWQTMIVFDSLLIHCQNNCSIFFVLLASDLIRNNQVITKKITIHNHRFAEATYIL